MAAEVEIECEVRAESDKAMLIYDGKREAWIPKSQITDHSDDADGRTTSIFIPEWLAKEKGLI
jgi:hypothetical protein